ncbi:MAG: CRISPR-associated endonuclease Cas2 [Dehalococcoidia bacterium]
MPATLLIYDIEHDGLRAKVANACLDYGLQRVQYSAFAGRLSHTRAEELVLRVKKLAGTRQVDLRLFPICDRDLQQALLLKQEAPDESAGNAPAPPATPRPPAMPAVVVVSSTPAGRGVALPPVARNDR